MNDLDTRLAVGAAYRRDPIATMHHFEEYRRLEPATASRVDDFLRAHGRDEDASAALRRLVQSGEFAGCDDAAKVALLDAALDHPDAATVRALQQLAGEPVFRELDGVRADRAAARVASGEGPNPRDALSHSGMPAPRPSPMAWNQYLEMGFQVLDHLEGVAGVPVAHGIAHAVGFFAPSAAGAALPIAGGALAGLSALASIYGSIHAAEQAHEDGRAIGEAAAYGHGFLLRLQEHASGSPVTPAAGQEARGAEMADAYWDRLAPEDRVVLRSPEVGGRFFEGLGNAILQRATGRGR